MKANAETGSRAIMRARGIEAAVAWGDPYLSGSDEDGGFVLPVGTVAFLLTDVEGSTRHWQAEAEAMAAAMDRHNAIVDAAVSAHGGVCPPAQGEGDSIVAAFARPSDAVLAALDAQTALTVEPWPTTTPLQVRMAVHTGEARTVDDGNYAGQAIIRTARLRAVAHGGQVLVSAPARDLTVDQLGDRVSFRDLGEHRLRDLARPERVYQLEGPRLRDEFEALASLDAHPHNLPVQLSSFVGRTEEVATVAGLLAGHRLVTVAGAGGAGKTRLAQHVAAEVLDRFADGAWWVELAEVDDPSMIAAAISTAIGVKAELGDSAVVALAERLGARHALIVLDNCEHVIHPVAELVDEVLRHCPGIAILATSREPLEVAGEVAWRIPPLGLPPEPGRTPIAALSQFESVRLFVERARNVRPNFHLTDDNGPTVAAICARLDGIPLAIELAAARIRSLSPERILGGLTDAFGLLTGGGRTALPRQQTLEASIAWSHDLLAPDEQVLLRRLAVFKGGCTLDDAELVVADDQLDRGLVLDLLDRLIAQSLVHLDDTRSTPRYRLLETVRQYADRRLDDADEGDDLHVRHAERFAEIAEQIGVDAEGPDEWGVYARAVEERDNLALALDTLASAGHWEDHARITHGLAFVRTVTDPVQSIRDLAVSIQHAPPESSTIVRLLAASALARGLNLDAIGSAADASACIALAEVQGDERSLGRAKAALGHLLAYVDPEAADAVLVAAIQHAVRASDPFAEVNVRRVRGAAQLINGVDPTTGEDRLAEAQAAADRLGNRYSHLAVNSEAALAMAFKGRTAEAAGLLDEIEEELAAMARATQLPTTHLLRNTLTGGVVLAVRVWLSAVGMRPIDLDELAETIRVGRAEGQHVLSVLVGSFAANARYFDGDATLALAELEIVAANATELGLTMYAAAANEVAALVRDEAGDGAGARALLATCEPALASSGSPYFLARLHYFAGGFAYDDGDVAEAERRAHACLSLAGHHDLGPEAAQGLELLSVVAAATRAPVEATRLAAAAAHLREEVGFPLEFRSAAARLAAALAACRTTLGDEAYEMAWAEGRALSLADAVEYAQRSRGARKRPTLGWKSLTPTEHLVVEQIEAGLSNPEIAQKLLISRDTVKTHLAHIFSKLGIKNRAELAAAAARRRD